MFTFDVFFFFKQKTAYEMRISDWSSDVCSSDLVAILEAVELRAGWPDSFHDGATAYVVLRRSRRRPLRHRLCGRHCRADPAVRRRRAGLCLADDADPASRRAEPDLHRHFGRVHRPHRHRSAAAAALRRPRHARFRGIPRAGARGRTMRSAATPTAPTASSRGWLLALAAAVAAGLGIRLLFLGDKALWLDEAYSVWFSQQSWHVLWRETPYYETHPPLYYSLLKLWRGLGSDEAVLRLLSVLANVATIGLVALTAYVAVPPPQRLMVACTSGLLFAVSPLQLGLAQPARPYALLMLGLGQI